MDSEPSFIPKVQFTGRYEAPSLLTPDQFLCRTLQIPVDDQNAVYGAVVDALNRLLDPLIWHEGTGSVSRFDLAAAISVMLAAFHESDCGGSAIGDMVKFFLLQNQNSSGGSGETVPAGAYARRYLNTEVFDADNLVVLANNQFEVQAGTYLFLASAPHVGNGIGWLKIKDVVGGNYVCHGRGAYTVPSTNAWNELTLISPLVVLAPTVFELWQFSGSGYGSGFGFDIGSSPNIYAQVLGLKMA